MNQAARMENAMEVEEDGAEKVKKQVSKSLIVGEKECTFGKIVTTIMETPDHEQLVDLWVAIANALDTPTLKKMNIKRELSREINHSTLACSIEEIISEWRCRAASNARLVDLIKVFKRNNLTGIVDALVEAFGTIPDEVDLR